MNYAIYGCGGFGREVAPLAQAFTTDVVFVDDAAGVPAQCNGVPVIDFATLQSPAHRDRQVILAMGSGAAREHVARKCLEAELTLGNLVAPTVRQLAAVRVGAGHVLCDQVILTANITIGRQFQCNLASYVGHDCVIGDFVTFAPRVHCNGNVHIGDFAYIGTGAMLKQGTPEKPLIIGEGAVIGMGAVVTKDVPPYSVVVGNPARVMQTLTPR